MKLKTKFSIISSTVVTVSTKVERYHVNYRHRFPVNCHSIHHAIAFKFKQ